MSLLKLCIFDSLPRYWGFGDSEELSSGVTSTCDNRSCEEHVPNMFSDIQTNLGQGVMGKDSRTSLHRGRGVLKALPVLRGVCERRHNVLLYEEEH